MSHRHGGAGLECAIVRLFTRQSRDGGGGRAGKVIGWVQVPAVGVGLVEYGYMGLAGCIDRVCRGEVEEEVGRRGRECMLFLSILYVRWGERDMRGWWDGAVIWLRGGVVSE